MQFVSLGVKLMQSCGKMTDLVLACLIIMAVPQLSCMEEKEVHILIVMCTTI